MNHWVSKQATSLACVLFAALLVGPTVGPVSAQESRMDNELSVLERFRPVTELPQWTERYAVGTMTSQAPLRISGVNSQMTIGFGGRFDRVVTGATLRLNYQTSPAIIDVVTQVRVLLNNEVTGVIPLRANDAGTNQSVTLRLDPRLFAQYNELRFELLSEVNVGQCTSASPSAWFEVLRNSELQLDYQQLKVADELAYFPEPWFDKNDFGSASLQFILPPQPERKETEALGIMASYFGMLADWRELKIEVLRMQREEPEWDEDWRLRWPRRHAIVMLTNDERPWALRNYPQVAAPQVEIIDNPAYPTYKLLVLAAPEAASLRDATATFVTGNRGLSGSSATINPMPIESREAYAAPRWISIDQPVRFADLVDHPSELERSASNRSPIQLELRLPPDLFTWQQYGIPIDLRFRYTPPIVRDESRMLVSVNNEFIKGFTMTEAGMENAEERVRVPLIDGGLFAENNVQIPSFKLGAINQLQFEFSFGSVSDACRVMPLQNARGAVDGNSLIDLRGYDHYVALPDVHLFAKTGFPFSKYDDLSRTRIVVPETLTDDIVQTLLTVVAKISSATGYPATQLTVTTIAELEPSTEHDYLILGSSTLREWLERFGDEALQAQLQGHALSGQDNLLYQPELALQNSGPSAAVVGFQSPFSTQHSVIAITATTDSYLERVRAVFNNASSTDQFSGFMAVLTPARVDSYDTILPYYVGSLSWWKRFTYHLAQYPMVVTLLALLAVLILALSIVRVFQRRAQQRVVKK